jgi:hypothetical protein
MLLEPHGIYPLVRPHAARQHRGYDGFCRDVGAKGLTARLLHPAGLEPATL